MTNHARTTDRIDHGWHQMVRGWVADHRGDAEATARWMAASVHIAGRAECRQLVAEAIGCDCAAAQGGAS